MNDHTTQGGDGARKVPGTFLVVGIAVIVAGGLLAAFAPDLFSTVGGWVTVAVVAVVAFGIGVAQLLRFIRGAAAGDDAHG
ncbi:hypothetical protein [Isoptericola aurantiacus]|uniref:hypothetical protein n=1 Tax=Isoptericola aurantiacus TaxID=3377839 RepID=UPI00383B9113